MFKNYFIKTILFAFFLNSLHAEISKSIFIDSFSLGESKMHLENVYGLEIGKTYKISFEMKKDKEVFSKASNMGIMSHINGPNKKKSIHWFAKMGSEVPSDGNWHMVEEEFKFIYPNDVKPKKNLNGAHSVQIILYNKSPNGGEVSIKNLSGLPKYVDYKFLGSKNLDLPKILLIGDSTMQHTYQQKVETFKDIASVYFIPINGGNTKTHLKNLKRWVGKIDWDLIYYNSGIHDLTRQSEKGVRGSEFPNRVDINQYSSNLDSLVTYLKQLDATLVWRSITPFRLDVKGRSQEDEKAYNSIARKIMDKHHVLIHDVTNARREELTSCLTDGVHFGKEGNKLLADEFKLFIKENKLL